MTFAPYRHKVFTQGLVVVVLAVLTACENAPGKSATEQSQAGEPSAAPEVTREITPAAVETTASAEQPPEPAWQYNIEQLLAEADAALAGDRLTTPIEDNAFDRYNAVLILQPDNRRAIDGLQEIFERYVLLAQDAMRTGELGKARALIERARAVNSEAPTVDVLSQELARLQRERARSQPQLEISDDQKEIQLNVDSLNRRDAGLVERLQGLAMQVRERDEMLLIVARSDAEGRWIYQQMAEGVPGYRLRGDIRLGREPKVLLLPPIE